MKKVVTQLLAGFWLLGVSYHASADCQAIYDRLRTMDTCPSPSENCFHFSTATISYATWGDSANCRLRASTDYEFERVVRGLGFNSFERAISSNEEDRPRLAPVSRGNISGIDHWSFYYDITDVDTFISYDYFVLQYEVRSVFSGNWADRMKRIVFDEITCESGEVCEEVEEAAEEEDEADGPVIAEPDGVGGGVGLGAGDVGAGAGGDADAAGEEVEEELRIGIGGTTPSPTPGATFPVDESEDETFGQGGGTCQLNPLAAPQGLNLVWLILAGLLVSRATKKTG